MKNERTRNRTHTAKNEREKDAEEENAATKNRASTATEAMNKNADEKRRAPPNKKGREGRKNDKKKAPRLTCGEEEPFLLFSVLN